MAQVTLLSGNFSRHANQLWHITSNGGPLIPYSGTKDLPLEQNSGSGAMKLNSQPPSASMYAFCLAT
uniref:Uncharacterized protein n=1 Tax=Rhizophora mucronata TaxID=61149 RepID=A0A2P2P467_RHIMU